jgi:RNA polymerase sigma factor for flagellar operon FliA
MLLEPVSTEHETEPTDQDRTAALWASHVARPDGAARAALVHAYQRFARILAAQSYGRRTTDAIEFDEYLQYAQVGLLEAIDRFEPARGIKFETFASMRITGAILNGLSRASELHEQLAVRKRVLTQRATALVDEYDAPSTTGDVFARLAEAAVGLAIGFMLEGSGMFQENEERGADTSYSRIELRQLREHVRAAVSQLSERQRQVIQAHYLHNEPFEQVAERLKLSRGRVSQLHTEGLKRLRTLLAGPALVDFSC